MGPTIQHVIKRVLDAWDDEENRETDIIAALEGPIEALREVVMIDIGVERQSVAMLSTAHITRNDDALLRQIALRQRQNDVGFGLIVAEYNGGWLVRVPRISFVEQMRKMEEMGLSSAFQNLISLASAQDFDWLRLDCDGPVLEHLPVFDW
jgi:DNA-binding GntR family transcriptional regulator